ncbi:type IX secretion system membrane protein PorP/SprF [Aquimarina sp. RZ0]|uniref:PorP/SprF family type IX secretion system membrane protein n=1 Tax=Aquimarina sp. RZ0 TaxID=2607730 RepID=UPI0011F2A459|nr:type IX secretion system membrane protein PorP/SprF [Aquimarina sp. RZ0]KAA1242965.1 type IX secretion system membrane protein PorP/SprF [Aquimarina sp. RZ0]
MKLQKQTVILLLLLVLPFFTNAQQDAQYTQYMYNTSSINPAYSGSREIMSLSALHRKQWLNIDGTPTTQTVTFDTPLSKKNNIGLGFSIINDKINPTSETYFNIDLAYAITVGNNKKISFGTKIGGHLLNVDLINLSRENTNDIAYENNIENQFNPNLGFGLYYHTNRFYFGISVPNLLETKYFDQNALSGNGSGELLAKERVNYYLITGHTFDLNSNIKFKPALLTKMVYGAPLQIDISTNFLFYEKLTLGAAYRWSAAVSGIVGFQLLKNLMIGFSFDYETTELSKTQFNKGSFEFLLRFDILNKIDRNSSRMLTPRFF